ncbi:uncharacterized protein LOC143809925 [Ranitomeya variabilis]|uniref:uncharacterized protein LOC143809925 n=1 Tax=Ranitomeya variabilis TaxID=490064 RepID=UPI00405722E8
MESTEQETVINVAEENILITDGDGLIMQISRGDDSELVLQTNYNVLSCIVEDQYEDIQTLFAEEEHVASNSTNNVIDINYLDDRPLDEGFVIPESNMMTHADSTDEEMKTMLAELHRKFGGDCESEQCFPSNPLRINNQNYIEFNDDTDENRSGKNDWCQCGNCVPMPTAIESICCQEIPNAEPYMLDFSCVTLHEFFHTFCERSETVNIVLRTVDHNLHPPPSKEMKRKLRKTAYRSFTAWIHGYLGAGNRRPIPSCVVTKVRFAFPDDDDEYMGFKHSNDYAAEFMALE